MDINSSQYWDKLYKAIPVPQFPWFEQIPILSLKMITMLNLPLNASIIDVGGGAGYLARQLLALGYTDITVLDFSEQAVREGKSLLGEHADSIIWLTMDLLDFKPERSYDLWHDRACLHFLQNSQQHKRYASIAGEAVSRSGNVIVAAVSNHASDQSSGLTVERFSVTGMKYLFANDFDMELCLQRTHITPANKLEPYSYYSFRKKK